MENPFRYGEVVAGEWFTDRDRELAELAGDIRSGQNVVIISPRRYGKTSLVMRAIEQLRRERVLVAYLDLFRAPTKDRFADHLAAALYSGLVAPVERVLQKAIELFQRTPVRPKVTIRPDGTPSFEFTIGDRSRDLDATIESLLTLPGQIARDRKRPVAVIFDEFQEVISIDRNLPALMRAVFQLQTEVSHVFLGSRRHLMQRVFTDENEPMYRLAKPLPLGPIDAAEFTAFIRSRFATTSNAITGDAIERILAITDRHPHDTQELSYFAWALANSSGQPATPATVDRALGRLIDAEDARYTMLWEGLSPHQRLMLIALLSEGAGVYSEDYRRRHRLGPASSVQRSMERLIERDLIETVPPAGYRIQDVFFQAWLLRFAGVYEGEPLED